MPRNSYVRDDLLLTPTQAQRERPPQSIAFSSPVAKQPARFDLPAGLDANEARAWKAGDLLSTRRTGIIRVAKGVNAQDTSVEPKPDLPIEIAHLLLIDAVGYSKLLVNEQIELLQELNQIVRSTECFRTAEKTGKLIRVPAGDGMALLFFHSPEEPVRCALEISKALQEFPHIQLRMGVHSGPVNQVTDVNDKTNIAGSGINVAQRVLDCGDAGHILLSGHVGGGFDSIPPLAAVFARSRRV